MIGYSWGIPEDRGTAHAIESPWPAFAKRLIAPPLRGSETMAEFAAMPKERRDALKLARWYVGGSSIDGKRTLASFPTRTMLTLDIDDATPAFLAGLLKGNGTEYVVHTTRSSTPERPRLRLILPLDEPVPADLHARAVEGLITKLDRPGVVVDRCSMDAARLLYVPTLCADAPHVAAWHKGRRPDVAALAALVTVQQDRAKPRHDIRVADWRKVLEELGANIQPSPRYKGEFTTLCVWHSEAHPSLDISPDTGKMFCWSCRRGGTAVSYVMQVLGCDAREAGMYLRSLGT